MFKYLTFGFKKGIEKIKNHPQLIYTILVAVGIFFAFIFTADRFLSIAQDAQDRLINVRVGSIHDTFAEFAPSDIDDVSYLQDRIAGILDRNNTILEFKLVKSFGDSYVVFASNNSDEVGDIDGQNTFLFNLAALDTGNSFTFEDSENDERFFKTVRAISDENGSIVATIFTKQTLSEADRQIQDSIRNSIIILVFILVLVLFLFFRHSRIIDYTVLYKKLKEVDGLKDDFISMASHELRTPLTVIRGYADMALSSSDPSSNQEYIKNIDKASKQLDGLVEDMLNVSRIEQGRMTFENKEINPQQIVEQNIASFEKPAHDKGLEIKKDIRESFKIKVDSNRFNQVMVNLIGNAVKYTKEGSVTIQMYSDKKRQYIRVIDTGIGLSEAERLGLFEKFYRVKNADTREVCGTGLGLWITKQIVDLMGGQISVESIKGVGSHFIVSFPIVS